MPKAVIRFFSATGNSRLAAHVMRDGLADAGWECELTDIRTLDGTTAEGAPVDADLLGFVFPIYAFRAAIPMERHIQALPSASKPVPVFLAATYAGYLDRAFVRLCGMLTARNYVPIVTTTLVCEDSWTAVRAPGWIYDEGRPDREAIGRLRSFAARELPAAWERNRAAPKPAVGWVPFNPVTALAAMFPVAIWKGAQFPIFVKRPLCDRCGACVRQCPMHRLRLDPYPTARGNCVGCYGCINVCPKDAINTWFTWGKIRYRGPAARLATAPSTTTPSTTPPSTAT